METFIASRWTGGNRVFGSKIIIDQNGVTLKDPGLFSGKEKTIPYSKISSVDIESPFIGFSTIIIETSGEGSISSHGFTKKNVKRMKELILQKI
jgi:uncharacterized membrane protein YdbT with pleckstrin-like domain